MMESGALDELDAVLESIYFRRIQQGLSGIAAAIRWLDGPISSWR